VSVLLTQHIWLTLAVERLEVLHQVPDPILLPAVSYTAKNIMIFFCLSRHTGHI